MGKADKTRTRKEAIARVEFRETKVCADIRGENRALAKHMMNKARRQRDAMAIDEDDDMGHYRSVREILTSAIRQEWDKRYRPGDGACEIEIVCVEQAGEGGRVSAVVVLSVFDASISYQAVNLYGFEMGDYNHCRIVACRELAYMPTNCDESLT